MTAAEGIRLAGLHPATLPLVMLPLIRARVAHQSCRQPCGQLPFPRVFPSHSQQTNCCGRTAQPSYSLTPRLNPHSLRHSRRTTRHRDFVLWRFLAAGRQSAWSDHRCRQPKTCTKHKAQSTKAQSTKARITAPQPCGPLHLNERTRQPRAGERQSGVIHTDRYQINMRPHL